MYDCLMFENKCVSICYTASLRLYWLHEIYKYICFEAFNFKYQYTVMIARTNLQGFRFLRIMIYDEMKNESIFYICIHCQYVLFQKHVSTFVIFIANRPGKGG